MNQPATDEITMLTALRPDPPADAEQIRQRAGRRLEVALTAAAPYREARPSRSRKLIFGAAAVAAAAGAAIVVPAVLPGSAGPLVTRAWAVTRGPDGAVTVTFPFRRALHDQAGLQRALRADGVPAYVRSMRECAYWKPQGGLSQIDHKASDALTSPGPGNRSRAITKIYIRLGSLTQGESVLIAGRTFTGGLDLQTLVMRNNRPPVCVPGGARFSPVKHHG
ncbi:MAG TPA: hypothetical protein VHU92_04115 [Streptosporangiaceae bacterium]|jgi:hypothetical protein|nr:hypothetical protein [Streptosporangiaceae bacterium]